MNNTYLSPLLQKGIELNQQFLKLFSHLSFDQLNWKPSPDRWSIGQVIDHLIVANGLYFNIFNPIIEGTKKNTFWEMLPFIPGFLGRSIIKSLAPDNRKKTKTFPVFEPSQSDIPTDALKHFVGQQEKLMDAMRAMDHLNHKKLIVTSPVAKFVTYSLKDACTIVITHVERHLGQAVEVMEHEAFPGN